MPTPPPDGPTLPVTVGDLLRRWRRARGRSQLDLSLDAGVSQRHLSFVETGRSVPSRDLLLSVAEALQVPLRDRNALLTAAGYAAAYPAGSWDATELGVVTAAVQRMLDQHEPFPAVVLDRRWTVLMTNAAAPRLFGHFVDLAARPKPPNLLHLMFDPAGVRPFVHDWPATAPGLIGRVYREAADADDRPLLAELMAYPDVDPAWATPAGPVALPVVPVGFVDGDRVVRYFSLVTTVGTPQTVAAQELRVECMFPADPATDAWHRTQIGGDLKSDI